MADVVIAGGGLPGSTAPRISSMPARRCSFVNNTVTEALHAGLPLLVGPFASEARLRAQLQRQTWEDHQELQEHAA